MKINKIIRFFFYILSPLFLPAYGQEDSSEKEKGKIAEILLKSEVIINFIRDVGLPPEPINAECPPQGKRGGKVFNLRLEMPGLFQKKELSSEKAKEVAGIFGLTEEDPIFNAGHFTGLLPVKSVVFYPETLFLMNKVLTEYPGLKETNHGSILFHGSNSASLLAFTPYSGTDRGKLIPTGELLSKGRVPFSGALDGISFKEEGQGVNNNHISTVFASELGQALGYAGAKFNGERKKWEFTVKEKKPEWLQMVEKGENPSSLIFGNAMVGKIFDKRHQDWKTLKEEEQDLVKNSFPVLYGLRPTEAANYGELSKSDVAMEILLKDGISSAGIKVIYIPQNKMDQVKELMRKHYPDFPFALEPLESLIPLPK